MATIQSLHISNFRGIKNFSQTFNATPLVCIIGRGDSGKSSILEAISYVLSPNWNLPFHDSDFYNCDTTHPIEIEVTVRDVPNELLNENKYGLYIRGLDISTGEIHDNLADNHINVLTIKLVVLKDLEPNWYVIKNDETGQVKFSASDRAKLNVFMVSDYMDRHFSWNKGNPLHSLLKQENPSEENENIITDALREAKKTIDTYNFPAFESVVNRIKSTARLLGIDISKARTTIDFRDLLIKDGKVSLHENDIPFRLKGKGSKRLISIAIQLALAESGGIILIDEIEQGLEPDRIEHIVNTLKKTFRGQVFITTHSRDVLVGLEASDLFLLKENTNKLITFSNTLQGCLRKNPEAFFAKKVIVSEGATEIGICRSLEKYRIRQGKENIAVLGIRFADGTGSEMINYAAGFKASGYETCLFCDSDRKDIKDQKENIREMGIEIIDWADGESLESTVLKSIPLEVVTELLELAAKIKHSESGINVEQIQIEQWNSIKKIFGIDCPNTIIDTPKLRDAIGKAANKGDWFKTQTKGEALGDLIFKHLDNLHDDNILKKQLSKLSDWIEQNGI